MKCHSCGTEMQFVQKTPFRTGGTTGKWKLMFGDLAELGEGMLIFDVHICPSCGEIRLLADELMKRKLLGKPWKKECVKCGMKIPVTAEKCIRCKAKQPEVRIPVTVLSE